MKSHTDIRVIYADTDAMGVVYHTNYIKWFEAGRGQFLKDIAFPYSGLEEDGIMLPVIECGCKYKLPAVYDDLLDVETYLKDLTAATVSMGYTIYRKDTREELVTGFTKHAITDTLLKPVRLKKLQPELWQILMDMKES